MRRKLADLEMVVLKGSSYVPVHAVRILLLRAWGAQIHPTATFYHGYEVRRARNLVVGARASIGNGAILDARGGLVIGADVNLSTGVHIWTGQHDWRSPGFAYTAAPVRLDDRVWLSARTTVLPGVTVGAAAVVAAGAVVSSDVAPQHLVGGVPARTIGMRDVEMTYELPGRRRKTWWW